MVAARYGTDHHELVLRPDATALLPEIAAAFDEPFADSSALPTYAVSRLAAGHVKVALSGEGGDELFGGYFTYVADVLAARSRAARRRGRCGRSSSACRARRGRVSLDYKAKRFVRAAARPPLERHHGWKEIFSADARAALLEPRPPGGRLRPARPLAGALRRDRGRAEPLARLQDVDVGTYLADDLLVKTDRASMAHSLEVRVPFLDPVVAELALALPTSQKVLAAPRRSACCAGPRAGLVPRRDRPRPEARLLDPGRGVAARRAAPVRARPALPGALRRDGFFRPGDGDAPARRARVRAARTTRGSSGACCASSCGGAAGGAAASAEAATGAPAESCAYSG